MKKATSLAVGLVGLLLLGILPGSAAAVNVGLAPLPNTAPDVLITSVVVGSDPSQPDYVEIYNQTDSPISLSGWKATVTIKDSLSCTSGQSAQISFPAAWILPKHYFTFSRDGDPSQPGSFSLDPSFGSACSAAWISSVRLFDGKHVEQSLSIPDASAIKTGTIAAHHQRGNSPNSTRTLSGDFASDYKVSAVSASTTLYNDGLYLPPPDVGGLKIVEILPNATDCSPLDKSLTCGDYIKLYNPTSRSINLALYRLRVGHKGQNEGTTNTFTWGQVLDPANDELDLSAHSYFTLATRNDGQALSVTDSGDYVWLEDAYGTTIYRPIVQYPSASSTSKVGWAWALNGTKWQWTSTPQPDAPNYFSPSNQVQIATISSSNLTPCAADQYRNPATNRCRLFATTTSGLIPCQQGQERNPATNRCRSIATATSGLSPCQPGWQRNPATNRCRKSSDVKGASITNVSDVKSPAAAANWRWFIASGAIAAALAYGAYEWRQEIAVLAGKAHSKLPDFLKSKR